MLAEMAGTMRSRVSFFMNKFWTLGFLGLQRWLPRAPLPPQYYPSRLVPLKFPLIRKAFFLGNPNQPLPGSILHHGALFLHH